MKEKMERLEAQLDQVRAQIVALQTEIEDGMEKPVKVVKEEVSVERRQMEEKASNIVLYGLMEAEGDDAKERKEKDEETVKKIALAIGVEIAGSIDAKYRAGKRIQGGEASPFDRCSRRRLDEDQPAETGAVAGKGNGMERSLHLGGFDEEAEGGEQQEGGRAQAGTGQKK